MRENGDFILLGQSEIVKASFYHLGKKGDLQEFFSQQLLYIHAKKNILFRKITKWQHCH